MRIASLLVVIWLLIGVFAGWQRGYYASEKEPGCARAATIAVTIVAGPLNYVGLNPKVQECDAPEPSR
jgi:hypothetical protein